MIHAFDDPIHAPIALEAALKYRDIAPAVSHARHMPSHIFIQHGMWDEVARWNESAFAAARDLWQPGDPVGEQNHANDWGQYGDLQLGDTERSLLWIERAEQTLRENPGDARSISTLATVKARHIIETQQWSLQPLTDSLTTDELLALGLSAVNLGDLELARQVSGRLQDLSEASPNNEPLKVSYLEVAAMTRFLASHDGADTAGLQAEGYALLQEAVAITEAAPLPNGAANPLKPVHELLGEALLFAGRSEEAARWFEDSLLRMPNRPLSLLGAARAYQKLDQSGRAAEKYRQFLAFWTDSDHPAVSEANLALQAL